MLILTRRNGETFHIGNDVEIKVLGVKGNQVRIGIDAPKGTPVLRDELLNRPQPGGSDDGNGEGECPGS